MHSGALLYKVLNTATLHLPWYASRVPITIHHGPAPHSDGTEGIYELSMKEGRLEGQISIIRCGKVRPWAILILQRPLDN
jgi:hypothetical protein